MDADGRPDGVCVHVVPDAVGVGVVLPGGVAVGCPQLKCFLRSASNVVGGGA